MEVIDIFFYVFTFIFVCKCTSFKNKYLKMHFRKKCILFVNVLDLKINI